MGQGPGLMLRVILGYWDFQERPCEPICADKNERNFLDDFWGKKDFLSFGRT